MTVVKMKMVKTVPKGWTDLKPFNESIDVFLPFKIPLREEHQENFNEDAKFTWSLFREKLEKEEKKLVALIDLVPHNQHYCMEEMIASLGFIPYYKIGCKGGNHLPNDAIFSRFCETVAHVLSARGGQLASNELIGVHCCKGVNRTGFMICKYLITVKHFEPSEAIEMFSRKRECEFDREKYVEHLLQLRSGSEKCRSVEEDDGSHGDRDAASIFTTPSFTFTKFRCNSSGSDTSSKDEDTDDVAKKKPVASLEHSE